MAWGLLLRGPFAFWYDLAMSVSLFLSVLGIVLLLLAGFNVPGYPRVSFGWLGLFLWFLATLVKL